MENNLRTGRHKKPEDLEAILGKLEVILKPVNQQLVEEYSGNGYRRLFIVGCARSGTTLLYQYLCYTGMFCYPSNFVSRFYYAPVLGALIQKALIEFDFRGEILGVEEGASRFQSLLGKTRGAQAPHEFWYFWKRFFQFGNDQGELINTPDTEACMRELAAFQSVFELPLVAKAMNLNWFIPMLAADPLNCFLFVKRDLSDNVRSMLAARREFFEDERCWYSFKPPGYEQVLSQRPEEQVVWQINATNQAVEKGLSVVEPSRVLTVGFEEFKQAPREFVESLSAKWSFADPCLEGLPERF